MRSGDKKIILSKWKKCQQCSLRQSPSLPPPSPQIPVIFVGAKRHSGETTRITKDSEGRWGGTTHFFLIYYDGRRWGGGVRWGEGRRERARRVRDFVTSRCLHTHLSICCNSVLPTFVSIGLIGLLKKTGYLGLNFKVPPLPHFKSSVNRNRRVKPISIMKIYNITHNGIQLMGSTINRNPAYNAILLELKNLQYVVINL